MYDKSGLFSVNFLQLLQSSGGFLLLMRHCGAALTLKSVIAIWSPMPNNGFNSE